MLKPFSIARLPRIEFGPGTIHRVPALGAGLGKRVLLVTGAGSFRNSPNWDALLEEMARQGLTWEHATVAGEPSPDLVDEAVRNFSGAGIDVVVGIGGGSVLDAAKAIAGLLHTGGSVMDHLEGVGPELPYRGPACPFIAVPTTAGTGSEATKNAVLSVQGPGGFKKSFRDDRLVAEYAVLDPDLLASCPQPQIAANGMDALTQLMESFVSSRANPLTDALARDGLRAVRDGLLDWYEQAPGVAGARARMAYAALLSGIALAQTGLGSVHGLASPLGAFFPVPHGVVCGTLVAEATRTNIDCMRDRDPENVALDRYAEIAVLMCGSAFPDRESAFAALVELLNEWTTRLGLPRLGEYGIGDGDLDHIVKHSRGSSMKTNPLVLTDRELRSILEARL